MSPASAASSSPVWKTFAASASDASAAGRLRVGRTIRFHSASTAAGDWPCSRSQAPNVRRSSAGSARSSFDSGRTARAIAMRSRRDRKAKRASDGSRCTGAGRRARPIQPMRPPGATHRDRQPALQLGQLRRVDALEEAPVRGAAAQEHVLAVVHPDVVAAERERRAAEPRPALEQRHLGARVGAVERGGDPGQSPSDDGDAHGATAARLLTATQPFSQVGSETRPRRTRSGRRSIRPSSRR